MKKLLLCFLLLCCFDAVGAEDWSSFSLASRTTVQPLITFTFRGHVFVPAVPIQQVAGRVDHSSPEALARGLFSALNQKNAAMYADVYHTTPDKLAYRPSDKNIVSAMSMRCRISYGDISVLLLEISMPEWRGTIPLYVQRQDGKYFGVLPEPNDPALKLLSSYVDYGMKVAEPVELTNRYSFHREDRIYFTNQFKGLDYNPLIVGFSGENLRLANPIAIDPHSSPQAVLRSAVAYASANDTNLYLTLIAPNQLKHETQDHKTTVENFICDRLPKFNQAVRTGFKMRWKISCSDLNIIFFQIDQGGESAPLNWIAFEQVENRWYLSDPMIKYAKSGSLFYPVLRYFGLPLTYYPNLIPVAKSK